MPRRRRILLPLALIALLTAASGLGQVRAQTPPAGPTFRGSSIGPLGPVSLHAGLVVVRARSNGSQNFAADLKLPESGDPAAPPVTGGFYGLFDVIGTFNGAAAAILQHDGDYYLDVTLASGPYELTLEQPTPESVTPVDQRSFGGRGQQVTPVFALPAGSYTVTVQADSYALRVWLFRIDDLGGAAVVSDLGGYPPDDRLIDTTADAPGPTTLPVTLSDDGLYLLYVAPGGTGSLSWTATIQ